MKIKDYTLTDITKNEWRDFALYTIESRAIPSMVDGLKPSQRFYLYSSIVNSSKEFKKVSAVAGIVSEYGYNHGEVSVASTGQLMAAEWNNNLCLIEGRGNFGTRLIQVSGASRYVYTRLHKNFNKYIRDLDLSPEHPDPEHFPPQYYIPVIPIVLANGVKGIATGFATNILPRKVSDIKDACLEYLKTSKIKKKLTISFPQFSGTTIYDEDTNKFICNGVFARVGKTKLIITEVPYGYDRETYVKILDDLEEKGDIVSYEDRCSSKGFEFEVKLKQSSSDWNDQKILKEFKLSKAHTENITVIDQNGNLKEYADERDLIKDFCDYRLTLLQKRIDKNLKDLTEDNRWLNIKMQFILNVIDNKIVFKNKTKEEVIQQIKTTTQAIQEDFDRLLRINILSLTHDQVKELESQIKENTKEISFWNTTTPKDQFSLDLKDI